LTLRASPRLHRSGSCNYIDGVSSVSVRMFQLVVAGAAAQGVPPQELLAAAGLSAELLADPDARLPVSSELRLWSEAVRLTRDESLGLRLLESLQIGDFGGIGYAVRSSTTLGGAYERVVRYLRLLNRELGLRLVVEGAQARLQHLPPTGHAPPRCAVEYLLGIMVLIGRRNIGDAFRLRAARFRHPAPASLEQHRQLFGEPLRFEQEQDELVFDRALLDRPQAQAEPVLCEVLDRHLQQMIESLPTDTGFLDRARACLVSELSRGEPTLGRIAQRLHMSERSLQRRLQQEGTTLQALLAGVRTDLAVRYLSEAQESISEVAFLLGFSEVSTFHRAFKRWTGLTPSAYRKSGSKSSGPGRECG
jgi:AraC-like DNA-binding protein